MIQEMFGSWIAEGGNAGLIPDSWDGQQLGEVCDAG